MTKTIQKPIKLPELFIIEKTNPVYRTDRQGRYFKISLDSQTIDEVNINRGIWYRHKVSEDKIRKCLRFTIEAWQGQFKQAVRLIAR